MRALEEVLGRVHAALAKDMLDRLENGPVLTDKEGNVVRDDDGVPLRRALTAAEWAAIAKFLKDNGIEAIPAADQSHNDPFERLIHEAQGKVVRFAS